MQAFRTIGERREKTRETGNCILRSSLCFFLSLLSSPPLSFWVSSSYSLPDHCAVSTFSHRGTTSLPYQGLGDPLDARVCLYLCSHLHFACPCQPPPTFSTDLVLLIQGSELAFRCIQCHPVCMTFNALTQLLKAKFGILD